MFLKKSVFHVPPTYSSLTNNQNITSVTSLKIKNITLKETLNPILK